MLWTQIFAGLYKLVLHDFYCTKHDLLNEQESLVFLVLFFFKVLLISLEMISHYNIIMQPPDVLVCYHNVVYSWIFIWPTQRTISRKVFALWMNFFLEKQNTEQTPKKQFHKHKTIFTPPPFF